MPQGNLLGAQGQGDSPSLIRQLLETQSKPKLTPTQNIAGLLSSGLAGFLGQPVPESILKTRAEAGKVGGGELGGFIAKELIKEEIQRPKTLAKEAKEADKELKSAQKDFAKKETEQIKALNKLDVPTQKELFRQQALKRERLQLKQEELEAGGSPFEGAQFDIPPELTPTERTIAGLGTGGRTQQVSKVMGAVATNSLKDQFGRVIPIGDRNEVIDYVTRELGPDFAQRHPEVAALIDKEFPATEEQQVIEQTTAPTLPIAPPPQASPGLQFVGEAQQQPQEVPDVGVLKSFLSKIRGSSEARAEGDIPAEVLAQHPDAQRAKDGTLFVIRNGQAFRIDVQ